MNVILWSNGLISTFKNGEVSSLLSGYVKDVGWKILEESSRPETGLTTFMLGDHAHGVVPSNIMAFAVFMENNFPR
jgi:hypothetical protein